MYIKNIAKTFFLTLITVLCSRIIYTSFVLDEALAETTSDRMGVTQDDKTNSNAESEDTLSGSQLWSNNCGRCHNKISPDKYSDHQWELLMKHMRSRANLTGQDTRAILEFLKSAN